MERKYSLSDVKLFLNHVALDIVKEYGIDVEVYFLTKSEYFENDIYKYYCLRDGKEEADTYPDVYRGLYLDNKLLIFLDYENNVTYSSMDIINLLIAFFHELTHFFQEDLKNYSSVFDYFVTDMEYFIMKNDIDFYKHQHDSFFIECDADKYGIDDTLELLKKYPNFYLNNSDELEEMSERFNCRFDSWNFDTIFNQFNNINKKNPYNGVFRNFIYDDNGCFKEIEEIYFGFKDFNLEDISYYILISDSYIRELDYDKLNDVQIDIMIKAINYYLDNGKQKLKKLENYLDNYYDDELDSNFAYLLNKMDQFEQLLDYLVDLRNSVSYSLKKVIDDKKPNEC